MFGGEPNTQMGGPALLRTSNKWLALVDVDQLVTAMLGIFSDTMQPPNFRMDA